MLDLIDAALDVIAGVDLLQRHDVRVDLAQDPRHPVGLVPPVDADATMDVVRGKDERLHGASTHTTIFSFDGDSDKVGR